MLYQWEGDFVKLCDGDCLLGECLEFKSEIIGRGQWFDVDYVWYSDLYGEDVFYFWLQQFWVIVGFGNEY